MSRNNTTSSSSKTIPATLRSRGGDGSSGLTPDTRTLHTRPSASIVLLGEVLQDPNRMLGWVVRILGRLRSYNVHTNMAQVEYRGQQLLVDTALLGIFDYKINSLYQWIGELVVSTTDTGDCICLQAKILRNVDELDTALFEESLKLRRQIMG